LPLLLAGAALGAWLVGVGLFAWQSARESFAHQSGANVLASKRIVALAKRRGTWVSFHSTAGKVTSGRLVEFDVDLRIVYLDTRKQTKSHENPGTYEFPDEVPRVQDLVEVDLLDIDSVEVFDE